MESNQNCLSETYLQQYAFLYQNWLTLNLWINLFHYGLVLQEHLCVLSVKVISYRKPVDHNVSFSWNILSFLVTAGLFII